jgi:hypothetical protein
MLALNAEQVGRLQALQMTRDQQRITELVAAAFPDAAGRLGERLASLVSHAVERSAAHGLRHASCVARYLACCCVLGADFETRPGHEWAAALLGDATRSEGAKAWQLCRRTREALGAANGAALPGFDQALAALDTQLQDRGPIGSLRHGPRIVLGQACDIDAVDVRPGDGPARQRYVLEHGQWKRVPWTPPPNPVTVGGAGRVAALPARLSMIAPSAGATPARLRVRCVAAQRCGPSDHPLLVLNDAQGLREWRGAAATDVVLELFADPLPEPPDGTPRPLIGAAGAPRLGLLGLAACGLRDEGAPFGEQQSQLALHPSEQHLMAWRREPSQPLEWPQAGATADPKGRTACRIECDGHALPAVRWLDGWAELDRQIAGGLERLYTAWGRESGLERTTLQAEPALMAGDAGLAWGWTEGRAGLADAPFFRVVGKLDLVACRLRLRLSGVLALGDSVSLLTLQCHAEDRLQAAWETDRPDAPMLPEQPTAQASFRLPFVLSIESIAVASGAMLEGGPASGAVVGRCGLRPRPDGAGLQWFAQAAIEPVHAAFIVHDPLRGETSHVRCLLPACR